MEELRFKYQITQEDFLNFNKWFVFERTNMRRVYNICLPLIYISAVAISFLDEISWTFITIAVVLTLVRFALFPFSIHYGAKKSFQVNKAIQLETEYIITEGKILTNSEASNFQLKWEDVHSAYENEGFFFIFNAPNSALIMAKKVLSEEQQALLKQYIMEKLPVKKRKKMK